MFGQDCGQAPFISKHTRPRCSGELCLLCWVTDTNMIFKQVQLYLFPFSCSTCMSTVLAKAAHSLYFWAATPKIPTAFYFDKQNQHVFAEFNRKPAQEKTKLWKNISSLNQTAQQFCQQFCQQFHSNCSAVWPNCSAVSPKLLSSLAKLLSSFPQTAQQFGQTAQQFGETSNCSAVSLKLLSSFPQTAGQIAEQFGKIWQVCVSNLFFWCTIMTWAERTMMCVWFFLIQNYPKTWVEVLVKPCLDITDFLKSGYICHLSAGEPTCSQRHWQYFSRKKATTQEPTLLQ